MSSYDEYDEREKMEMAKLRAEFAEKNNVLVSLDDPTMLLFTATRRLSIMFSERLKETFEAFRPDMEEIFKEWSLEAKEKAERVLTASVNANKQMIDDTAKMFSENAAIEFSKAMKPLLKDFEKSIKNADTRGKNAIYASYLALASSGVTLIAVLFLLYRMTSS